jgi:copper transport protein
VKRLVLVALLMVLTWATPALAHASLVSTTPMSNEQLQSAPPQVSMHFSEPVTATQDTFRVYDEHGKQIKTKKATHPKGDPTTLGTVLPRLDKGRYTVVWRVVSADSHPVHGAFPFNVGEVANDDTDISRSLLSSDHASPAVRALQATARGILLFGIIGAVGAGFWMQVWREDRLTRRFARISFGIVGITTIVGILSQGVYANARPLTSLFNIDLIRDTLNTRFGHGAELRLTAVVLALVFFRQRFAPAIFALAIVLSLTASGHASTGRLPYVGMVLDILHIGAASAWFGGLAIIVLAIFRNHQNKQQMLRTFSRMALVCASTILVTGLLQAFRQLRSWHALTATDYGRLVVTKLILFLVIIAVARFSRRAVRAWNSDALRTLVSIEALFASAVIVITTILISTSPTASKPTSYDRTSRLNGDIVQLHIDKTATGAESMSISVEDGSGSPLAVPEVTMSMTLANEGIGPIDMALQADGNGRYSTTNATVPLPGTWTVRVTVRTTDIDQASTSFAVHVS